MNIEKILNAVNLYEHNLKAYEKVKESIEKNKKTCVVHATGTGKSFLAIKLMLEILLSGENKNVTYIYPLGGIKEQIEEHIESLKSYMKDKITDKEFEYVSKKFSSIEFLTYQSLITKNGLKKSQNIKSDLFVVDEFHHIGAPEWTRALNTFFDNNENAKIFGMSATPVRNSGTAKEENVVETFFEGNIASTFDLSDAISSGVLPEPDYHCASFYLEGEIESIEEKLNSNNISDPKEKEEYKNALIQIKTEVANLDKETDIFRKNLKKDGKYIYFCPKGSNISELQEKFLENLPKEYRDDVEFYSVHSSENTTTKNKLNANNFYNNISNEDNVSNNSNKLRVMFAIDMYNEGIHVPDIDGVIMGRASKSDIIFYQQLGRALAVKKNSKKPLIIDLMGNIYALQALKQKTKEKSGLYKKEITGIPGLVKTKDNVNSYDFGLNFQMIDVLDRLNELKNRNTYYESDEYMLKNTAGMLKRDIEKNTKAEKEFKSGTKNYSWVDYNRDNIKDYAEKGNEYAQYIVSECTLFLTEEEKFINNLKNTVEMLKRDAEKTTEEKKEFKKNTKNYSWVQNNRDVIKDYAEKGNEDAQYIATNCALVLTQEEKFQNELKNTTEMLKRDIEKNTKAEKEFKTNTKNYSWVQNHKDVIKDYAEKGNEYAQYIVSKCTLFLTQEDKSIIKEKEFIDMLEGTAEMLKRDIEKNIEEEKEFKINTKNYSWVRDNKSKIKDYAEKGNEYAEYIVAKCAIVLTKEERYQNELKNPAEMLKRDAEKTVEEEKEFKKGTENYNWVRDNKFKIKDYAEKGNEDAQYIAANCTLVLTEEESFINNLKNTVEMLKRDAEKTTKEKKEFKSKTKNYYWVQNNRDKIKEYAEKGNKNAQYILSNCTLLKSDEEWLYIKLTEILIDFKEKNASDNLNKHYKKQIINIGLEALNKTDNDITAIDKICITLLKYPKFNNSIMFKNAAEKLNAEIGLDDILKKTKRIRGK